MKQGITMLICSGLAVCQAAGADYLREIKPIFSKHCVQCHGASQQKGGLRMDTAAAALRGGDSGSGISPGNSGQSLLLQVVKGIHPEIPVMPYKKPALSKAQIDAIEHWIDSGAPFPKDEIPGGAEHWAFVPPRPPQIPPVRPGSLIRNPIDRFIQARLEQENLQASPEADRATLLRRAALDLTGLPPSPEELERFLGDSRPDAYEREVERLLASPHYGERWGRLWLDVARYADSNGYSLDSPRSIWKYRDWVIRAFNRDLPYDRFIIEQIAGDLLPGATLDQKIATGFNRNTQVNQEGGIDPEQFRVESVLDRVNTTATAFLGITLACAQCHDHKFDPFTQREYYQFYAFFNNTVEDGHGKGSPEGILEILHESENGEALESELEEAEADLDRYLDTQGSAVSIWAAGLQAGERSKMKPEVRAILDRPFAELNRKQKRTLYGLFNPEDPAFRSRQAKITALEKKQPKPVTTLVMVELPRRRESVLFIQGDFTRRGEPVAPGYPAILAGPRRAGASAREGAPLSRLDLAYWIADPGNPLTARVMVNRIWQQYFGRGLVETENDFGTQCSEPTHPKLLDWLACELMDSEGGAWSMKKIHRLIVTSATYRQSSRARPELSARDPNNKLLARQRRLRLDAELVRDVALFASGLFSPKMFGPPVFPPQPDGVMTLGQSRREWKPSRGEDRHRRGLYTHFWRATPHPALMVFDAADGMTACTRRPRSNTPLQALTLLNDEAFFECARSLAARILRERPGSDAAKIDHAFRLCLSRQPGGEERNRLLAFLQAERAHFQANRSEAQKLAGKPMEKSVQAPVEEWAAWISVSRVLLNLDEMITRE